jgi:hypothetical protein
MSTSGKLAAGLSAIVLLGAAAITGFVVFGSGSDEPASVPRAGSQTATKVPADNAVLLRPAGAAGDAGEQAAGQLADDPAVDSVHRYLTGELPDGTPVVGLAPLEAPLRTPEGKALPGRFLVGRGLQQGQAGPAGVAGRTWAEENESIYGFQVAGMISDHPAPVELGGVQLTVTDIVDTGDPAGDRAVFVPLEVARQILGEPDGLSWVAAEPAEGADAGRVRAAAERAGFEVVDQ